MKEVEAEVVEPIPATALTTLNSESIDQQIATAKRYPRSLTQFRKNAMDMATVDEETAGSMYYALKRSGKVIEGPSIRLAEIIATCWGNLHMAKQTGDANDRFAFGDGAAWDLETNVRLAIRVGRRITGRDGRRYNDDMIATTSLAAMSVALRNAILGVVPGTFIRPILEKCKAIATGEGLSMEKRRQRVVDYFVTKLGLKPEQVFKIAGKPGMDDLTVDDLATLHGIGTALKDGETTLQQVLADADAAPKTVAPTSLGVEALKGAKVAGKDNTSHHTPTAEIEATGVAQAIKSNDPATLDKAAEKNEPSLDF